MLKGQDDGTWSVSLRSRGGDRRRPRRDRPRRRRAHAGRRLQRRYLDREKTIEALRRELSCAGTRPPSVLALAAPALVVLAAEPLYLLVDTAVVGNLGTVPLGGLAVGGGLLAWAAALLNFLAYGTTARSARRAGAGDRAGAVDEGVQATWLALALGLVVLGAVPAARRSAHPAAGRWRRRGRRGGGAVAARREPRCAAAAGLARRQRLAARRPGAAPADALRARRQPGQPGAVPAAGAPGRPGARRARRSPTSPGRRSRPRCSSRALAREGCRGGRGPAALRAQLVIGRDLLLRAVVLQVSFLVATGVVARAGHAALGAHQIAVQLFFFLALVLDAYAIAAQTLVGHALGGGRPGRGPRDRPPGRLVGAGHRTRWSRRVLLGRCDRWSCRCSPTTRRGGAGDRRVVVPRRDAAARRGGVRPGRRAHGRRRRRLPAHRDHRRGGRGFLPLSLLALPLGWGLAGVWAGLTLFIGLRLVGVLVRVAGDRWLSAPVTVTS